MQQYRKNLGKVSLTAEGAWNLNNSYDILSIVYDEHTQHGFISRKAVPQGVDLYNKEYWMPLNVSGYADNNVIILSKKTSEASIQSYTLEEAIASIKSVGRRPGAILGFYNENNDRLDIGGRWELWQFNDINVYNWENVDSWQNLYYNYNKFMGWFKDENFLTKYAPFPEIGCYAFVGSEFNEATVYRCDNKYVWNNTTQHAWDYVKIIVEGNVSVGENGNWFNNGEDTGIPASVKGENGKTPVFREKDNTIQYSFDNVNWITISDKIAAWFRWNATTGDTQANNVGRIQISRDNVTWTNLSGDIINNLHISRYIGADESLPTSGIAEGTIYAKGPTYADGDTSHVNPIYRLWVYAWKGNTLAWQDNGEFTSIAAGVVQETGGSETEVMSQKAVSTKLSELGSEVNTMKKNAFGELKHIMRLDKSTHSSNTDILWIDLNEGDVVNVKVNPLGGVTSTRVQVFFRYKDTTIDSTVLDLGKEYTYTATSRIDSIGVYFEGEIGGEAELSVNFANGSLSDSIEDSFKKIDAVANTAAIKRDGKLTHPIHFDGSTHSSSKDILNVNIPSNTSFMVMIQDDNESQPVGNYGVYLIYADGESELVIISKVNTSYTFNKSKDIVSIGVYKEATIEGSINLIVGVDGSLSEKFVGIEDSLSELSKATLGTITQRLTLKSNYHSSILDQLRVNLSEGENVVFLFEAITGITSNKVSLALRTNGESVDSITLNVGKKLTYTATSRIDSIGVYFEGEIGGEAELTVDVRNESLFDVVDNQQKQLSAIESVHTDISSCEFTIKAKTEHSSSLDRVFMKTEIGDRFTLSITPNKELGSKCVIYVYHKGVSTILENVSISSGITKTYTSKTPTTSIGIYYYNDSESDITIKLRAERVIDKGKVLDYNVNGAYGFAYRYAGLEHSSSLDRVILRIKDNVLKLRVLSSNPEEVPNMQVFANGDVVSGTISGVGLYDLSLPKDYSEFEDVAVGIYIAPNSPEQDFIFEYYTGGSNLIDNEPVKNDVFATFFKGTEDVESYLYFTDPHTMSRNYQGKSAFDNHMNHIKKIADGNPINFVMCGGDWLNNMDTQDEACAKLAYIRARMNSFNVQGYNVVGNHDLNYMGRLDSSSEQYTGTLTEATVGNLWYGCKKTYYDFHTKQTRVYVLDTGTDSHHVNASSLTRYEIEQCQWLCKSLSDNKDDKHIILSFHIYYVNQIVPYFVETLIDIISTYNSRGSYEINGESYDFVDNVGVVHCCICGHSHMDFNVVNKGIPVIGTTIASEVYDGYYDGGSIVTLDLVLLDYTRKKFRSVRYGNGENRDIDIL